MVKHVKKIIKKVLHRGPSVEETIAYLKNNGAQIGENLNVYGRRLNIDTCFPFMLHIGNEVEITADVCILNHDYSWCVIKKYSGELLGGVGYVHIGDNVFIGTGATILMNTHIGNNTIVGARSVVSGKYPDNVVIAGCPARVVCTIEEYIEKRRDRQVSEAIEIVKHYRYAFGKNPTKDKLPAYFWLFEPRENSIDIPVYIQRMQLKGNYDLSIRLFKESKPMFKNYQAFLDSIPFEQ